MLFKTRLANFVTHIPKCKKVYRSCRVYISMKCTSYATFSFPHFTYFSLKQKLHLEGVPVSSAWIAVVGGNIKGHSC